MKCFRWLEVRFGRVMGRGMAYSPFLGMTFKAMGEMMLRKKKADKAG
jgi:hypothetical protein